MLRNRQLTIPPTVTGKAEATVQTIKLISLLKDKNILFDSGLNETETLQVEQKFNVVFPPDLKLFLQTALPISDKFPNWRKALTDNQTTEIIKDRLEEPLSGILFDIEHNNFWATEFWGELPNILQQKISIATDKIKDYPKLIPIFAHRYISSEPNETDNPIYSVPPAAARFYHVALPASAALQSVITKHYASPSKKHQQKNPRRNRDFYQKAENT